MEIELWVADCIRRAARRSAGLGLIAALLGAPAAAQQVQLLSKRTGTASDTAGGISSVVPLSLTADGRYLVFTSTASNLVAGQVEGNVNQNDVFLYDRVTGARTLVSHGAGTPATTADGVSDSPVISADGAYVAFRSGATNLVAGQVDTNATTDVFLFERATGTVSLASRAAGTSTTTGSGTSGPPAINGDGGFVAFASNATNLVAGQVDTNAAGDIFVLDRASGAVALGSRAAGTVTTAGNQGTAVGNPPAFSTDGSSVAFTSNATNLVVGQVDGNGTGDVFLFDRLAGTVTLVSRAAGTTTTSGNAGAGSPSLSDDGTFVAFLASATNLATGQVDTNAGGDVFLFDRVAGTVSVVSRAAGTAATTGNSGTTGLTRISGNGSYVAFGSNATNHAVGQVDTNATADVFLFDRGTGTVSVVSRAAGTTATTGTSVSEVPSISADGSHVAFQSFSSDLVVGQVDAGFRDAFVFERATGTTSLVSRVAGTTATTGGNQSAVPSVVSADGGFVAFHSNVTSLVLGAVDLNGAQDVFLFDRLAGVNALASRRDPGLQSDSPNGNSATRPFGTSADGRYIVFISDASNLVPGQAEGNNSWDVFLADRVAGTVALVSHSTLSATTTGNAPCTSSFTGAPLLSDDGGWVAFACDATDLVPGQVDTNAGTDVFLFERATGTVRLVSHTAASGVTAGNNTALPSSISADGSFLVFASAATNLVTGQIDTNGVSDVFLFDRGTNTSSVVSRRAGFGSTTATGSTGATDAVISLNSAFVAFESGQTDLVPGQVDGATSNDVFLFERATGSMSLASHLPGAPAAAANSTSTDAAISQDGSFVAFASLATNLVAAQSDSNGGSDVFLLDRATGTVSLASRNAASSTSAGDGTSSLPGISDDGGLVVFLSRATNLVTGQSDANGADDVFLFDRVAGVSLLVSRMAGTTTTAGNGTAFEPVVSGNGATVAFRSTATNLVTGQVDGNGASDLFVFSPSSATTALASRVLGTTATTGTGSSSLPFLSRDGNFVSFTSGVPNLVAGDFNATGNDAFIFGSVTPLADLAITKDDGQTSAVPGLPLTYTIVARNLGTWPVTGATVADVLPASLTGATWTCAASPGSNCTASGSSSILDTIDLPVGGTATYTVSATVDPSATGLVTNTATVGATLGPVDPAPANNSATDLDALSAEADLQVSLLDSPDPVTIGGTLTYTATARNLGPSTSTGSVVVVLIPPGTTLLSAVPVSCTPGGGTVTCAVASLLPGDSFVVTVQVSADSGETVNGSATVFAGPEPDPDLGNNSATATTTILASAVLTFTVTSKNGSNTLEWLNSAPGLATVIVASSTQCPIDPTLPTDGDRPAGGYLFSGTLPGTKGFLPDAALTNGQTYYYTAFVDLGGGAFSAGHCTTGRPFDNAAGQPEEGVRWAFATAATAVTPPGVGANAVFVVSNDRGFHAMDRGPTGGTWPVGFTPLVLGEPAQSRPPVVPTSAIPGASRVVFLGSQDGTVYAVNADVGGVPLQQSGPLADRVQAAPAGMFTALGGAYDILLVGSRNSGADNVFHGRNVSDLSSAWQYAGPGDPFGIVSGGASVDYATARVYFASRERGALRSTLRCLSFTGAGFAEEWKAAVGNVDGSPTLAGGVVYVGNTSGIVHARDATLGTPKWTFATGDGPVKGFIFPDRFTSDRYLSTTGTVWGLVDQGPTVAKKWPEIATIPNPSIPLFVRLGAAAYIYVGSSNGRLYEIDAATGVVTGSVALGGGGSVVGAPSFDTTHNLVYVGSDRGVVYAVQAPLP